MATEMEPVTMGKVVFLGGIILCIVGLKAVAEHPPKLPKDSLVQDGTTDANKS